ncbi:MAG: hypothetical protein ACLVJJ_02745 [Eggerthella lenta]
MKRTNPKDNDDPGWVRISWEEAFSTITQKLEETAEKYSGLSVFGMSGTSRQWACSPTAPWASWSVLPTWRSRGRCAKARVSSARR